MNFYLYVNGDHNYNWRMEENNFGEVIPLINITGYFGPDIITFGRVVKRHRKKIDEWVYYTITILDNDTYKIEKVTDNGGDIEDVEMDVTKKTTIYKLTKIPNSSS